MMQPLNKNVIMDIQSKERRFEMSSGFSSKEPLEKQSLKITKKCLISIFMLIFGAKIQTSKLEKKSQIKVVLKQ